MKIDKQIEECEKLQKTLTNTEELLALNVKALPSIELKKSTGYGMITNNYVALIKRGGELNIGNGVAGLGQEGVFISKESVVKLRDFLNEWYG